MLMKVAQNVRRNVDRHGTSTDNHVIFPTPEEHIDDFEHSAT